MVVTLAVEGLTDEAVVKRLLADTGHEAGPVYGLKGKAYLDSKLSGYNNAARFSAWLVLRDLDAEEDCAPPLRARLLPAASRHMRLHIAVRTVESWLIADHDALSRFLGIRTELVAGRPDELAHPKRELINLARRSRKRTIREALVPATGSAAAVGSGYSAALIEFVATTWQPAAAAQRSESLDRLLTYLRTLGQAY